MMRFNLMRMLTLLAGVATLAMTCCNSVTAGGHGLFRLRPFHHGADCGCAQPSYGCATPGCAMPGCATPGCAMPTFAPLALVPPSCASPGRATPTCAAPAIHAAPLVGAGCCGLGGAAGISSLYAGYGYGGSLTGYEGLPNMDGGGVHARYPYHSYRRPWAHPGPASTNINIVW